MKEQKIDLKEMNKDNNQGEIVIYQTDDGYKNWCSICWWNGMVDTGTIMWTLPNEQIKCKWAY